MSEKTTSFQSPSYDSLLNN